MIMPAFHRLRRQVSLLLQALCSIWSNASEVVIMADTLGAAPCTHSIRTYRKSSFVVLLSSKHYLVIRCKYQQPVTHRGLILLCPGNRLGLASPYGLASFSESFLSLPNISWRIATIYMIFPRQHTALITAAWTSTVG